MYGFQIYGDDPSTPQVSTEHPSWVLVATYTVYVTQSHSHDFKFEKSNYVVPSGCYLYLGVIAKITPTSVIAVQVPDVGSVTCNVNHRRKVVSIVTDRPMRVRLRLYDTVGVGLRSKDRWGVEVPGVFSSLSNHLDLTLIWDTPVRVKSVEFTPLLLPQVHTGDWVITPQLRLEGTFQQFNSAPKGFFTALMVGQYNNNVCITRVTTIRQMPPDTKYTPFKVFKVNNPGVF